LTNGSAKCWGENNYGQLGNNSTDASTTPVYVYGISDATDITTASDHACVLLSSSQVKCWGKDWGLMGDGSYNNFINHPVSVIGLTGVSKISAGGTWTCALLNDGTVKCWGGNSRGNLGTGTVSDGMSVPVSVSGLTGVSAISAGTYHTCALLNDNKVKCWGGNSTGQLGDGSATDRAAPVEVSGLSNVVSISAGDGGSCALLSTGLLKCWGSNNRGQIGDGTTSDRMTPTTVTSIPTAASLSRFTGITTCSIIMDGTVRCWGWNQHGQIGDGTTVDRYLPTAVSGF